MLYLTLKRIRRYGIFLFILFATFSTLSAHAIEVCVDDNLFSVLKWEIDSKIFFAVAKYEAGDGVDSTPRAVLKIFQKNGSQLEELESKIPGGPLWTTIYTIGDKNEFLVCGTMGMDATKYNVFVEKEGKLKEVFDGGSNEPLEFHYEKKSGYRLVTLVRNLYENGHREFVWDGKVFAETEQSKKQKW
jgi:hypothetical protein